MLLGYRGSYQCVRTYLHDKRTSPRPVTAQAALAPGRRRVDPPAPGFGQPVGAAACADRSRILGEVGG